MGCGFPLLGCNHEVMSRSFQGQMRCKLLLLSFTVFEMIINTG